MKILSVLLFVAGLTFAQFPSKKTSITVNEPIMVAGVPEVTLQPGKYVLRLLEHDHNRNIVQIFNDREDKLYTTVLAINNYRLKPTGKTVLQYWETPKGNPPALRAWFAPGDEWGQEFVYPKGVATRIASQTGGPVLTARTTTEAELRSAPVTQVGKTGEEKPLEQAYVEPAPQVQAQARPPAPVPAQTQAPAAVPAPAPSRAPTTELAQNAPPPQPAPAAARTEALPATGSPVYAIGLAGLLIAAAGFALRRALLERL